MNEAERDISIHSLVGVREGTIITAILVGVVSKQFDRMFGQHLKKWIGARPASAVSI